jgi:hypothetical protein
MREAVGEEREKERDGSGQSDPVFSETLPLSPIRMLKALFPHSTFNPNSNPFNKPNPKPI